VQGPAAPVRRSAVRHTGLGRLPACSPGEARGPRQAGQKQGRIRRPSLGAARMRVELGSHSRPGGRRRPPGLLFSHGCPY